MNQVLSFWLQANSAVLAGLCLWCLYRAARGSRSRWLLTVLALVSGFVGLFTYAGASSLAGAGVSLNSLGNAVVVALAVLAPTLGLFTLRFVRHPKPSHA